MFVVGCPRSGTTLLYHMLVSSGHFANYRAETHLYDMLLPRFGRLSSKRNRRRLLRAWLRSHHFERTGLERDFVTEKVLRECRDGGDFLEIHLGEMARRQGRERWAECTPAHLLYMDSVKRDLSNALFLHIVRDGRDVALSMSQLGWIQPLPWDRDREVLVGGWVWEWVLRRGRRLAATLGADYREVRFEELVNQPRQTLRSLEDFVGVELSYDRILAEGVGSVSRPNTAFGQDERSAPEISPVGRWRQCMTPETIAAFGASLGGTLADFGYDPDMHREHTAVRGLRLRKAIFRGWRNLRHTIKRYTPLSRLLTATELPD